MDNFLKETLDKVDKWLHYAEAKNAIATGIYLTLVIKLLDTGVEGRLRIAAFILFIVSLIINGLSFFPNTSSGVKKDKIVIRIYRAMLKGIKWVAKKIKPDNTNQVAQATPAANEVKEILFFYGHIINFKDAFEEYLNKVKEKYSLEDTLTNLHRDQAKQILTKAKITSEKFELFKISLITFSLGFAILVISSYNFPNSFKLEKTKQSTKKQIEVNIKEFTYEDKKK